MQPLRIVVVGGLNMDLVVKVPRLPRPGETIAGENLERAAGGKGANQAVAAARLGAEVTMVGRVGRDAFGHALTQGLRDEGVATRWVLGSERSTGAALIAVDADGQNSIVVAAGANLDLLPDDVPRKAIEAADVVVAALEVALPSIEEAFRLARMAGVRTVLNAAPAQSVPAALMHLTDVVICNETELAALTRTSVVDAHALDVAANEIAAAVAGLRHAPDQSVVVTLGERGAVGVVADAVIVQPAFAVDVVDTTGAGDAFVAGFVTARWWDVGLAEALRAGCAAGSLATTRPGAQPSMPRRSEVDALLARYYTPD